MSSIRFISFLAIAATLSGCASRQSSDVYSRGQAMQTQTIQTGTVQSVRTVQIEGTKSNVGTIGGGIVGGVLGSTVGGGKGRTLATLGGAVVGAVGGSMAEEKLTRKDGLEITVQLDGGSLIAVVQEADVLFSVGDRVRVLTGGGTTRVVK